MNKKLVGACIQKIRKRQLARSFYRIRRREEGASEVQSIHLENKTQITTTTGIENLIVGIRSEKPLQVQLREREERKIG